MTDIELINDLSLVSTFEVRFSFFKKEVSPPIFDEWQLKESLKEVIKRISHYVVLNDRELKVSKAANFNKTKKDDPVAFGSLTVLSRNQNAEKIAANIAAKLKRHEFRTGASRLILQSEMLEIVSIGPLREKWESEFGHDTEGYKEKEPGKKPDTLILSGIPSKWLAEPKVSSNPSTDVAKSLFSKLAPVRKVEIVGSTEFEKLAKSVASSGTTDIASRLNCQVYVQFEDFDSFLLAVEKLLGKSLIKSGTSLVANYGLDVDTSDYFSDKNVRFRRFERIRLEEDERRKEMIRERRAELVKLEKLRKLAEEKERILREQEEKIRAEEEEAMRLEEERRKIEEEKRRQEEEQARLAEERRTAERKRLEQEERERAERQMRVKKELEARLEAEKEKVARQREVREREEKEKRLRAELEAKMREKRLESSRRMEEFRQERRRSRNDFEESGDDRWRLDLTESAASLVAKQSLARFAEEASELLLKEPGEKSEGEEEDMEETEVENEDASGRDIVRFSKKLRSVVVQEMA